MAAPRKYPNELRERAQRLVHEAREQDPELTMTAAVRRIGERTGVNPDTLRGWCKQAAIESRCGAGHDDGDQLLGTHKRDTSGEVRRSGRPS